ncbi:MAG: 3-dehydroquinate synthase, partial [Ilumatobacter sp.]|nr:3-dehydroquinate synthase [Ilumatobacter sp.]
PPLGLDADELVSLMYRDKKAVGSGLTYVLDGPAGLEVVSGVGETQVRAAMARILG